MERLGRFFLLLSPKQLHYIQYMLLTNSGLSNLATNMLYIFTKARSEAATLDLGHYRLINHKGIDVCNSLDTFTYIFYFSRRDWLTFFFTSALVNK